jgi:uncharacterized protein (DUF302 family)
LNLESPVTDQALAFQAALPIAYGEAIDLVREALKKEGFGVLTQIDVKATIKEKLGEDFRPYVILGACNPPLAHRALQADSLVGVMLPCNVTVEEHPAGALVTIMNPAAMMGMPPLSENEALIEVAADARARLERVLQALQDQT